ncbi:MAG: hypothetical protein AB7I38_17040 [Dehalococcoidia bacterium]
MSWATMRAAVKDRLDGLTISTPVAQTLKAYEYAPGGRQDLTVWPYAFPLPLGRNVHRDNGEQRVTTVPFTWRVMLAPRAQAVDMQRVHQLYDAWCDALVAAFDDAVALDETVDYVDSQEFQPLQLFLDLDVGWGFDMVLQEAVMTEIIAGGFGG